jgi:hypothetical protein
MDIKLAVDVNIFPDTMTVWEFYNKASEGKIALMPTWLQRLKQTKRWSKNKGAKTKSFLRSFFGGNNYLTPFYLVKIKVIYDHIRESAEATEEKYLKLVLKDMLFILDEEISKGAEYVLLDGQNRLFEAIMPFFDSELKDNNYDRPFTIFRDGNPENLNNFRFCDLDEEVKEVFQKTQILFVEGESGSIEDYVKSIVDLNNGVPWSEIEAAIIQPTALTYLINRDTSRNPFFISLFGNDVNISGNVYGMSGAYELEKKGDCRFLAELVYYIGNDANSGIGSESEISKTLKVSEERYVRAYERVSDYLTFISKNLDCLDPANSQLKNEEKPLNKDSLRSLICFLDVISNRNNCRHGDSLIKISNLNQISQPRNLIEDFLRWYEFKTDQKANPDDFVNGEVKPETFVINTRGSTKENMMGRLKFIMKEFIANNYENWLKKNVITEKSIDYRKQEVLLKRESDYVDRYTRTGKKIDIRSKISIDHIRAKKGPNKGSDEPENLVVTNPLSNSIKSNRY